MLTAFRVLRSSNTAASGILLTLLTSSILVISLVVFKTESIANKENALELGQDLMAFKCNSTKALYNY